MAQQGLLANLPRPESLMSASKDSKTLGGALVQLLNNWYLLFQNVVRNTGIWTPQPNGNAIFACDNDQTGTTLAVNGTFNPFGNSPNFSGLFIIDNLAIGTTGLFLQGGAIITLVSQTGTTYTIISGNAGTVNVFLTGAGSNGVVTIENKTAGALEIRVMGFRVRSAT